MALEELEAFLGRSVEPLTPLPLLADPASPQPSSTGWWQICHVAPPSADPGLVLPRGPRWVLLPYPLPYLPVAGLEGAKEGCGQRMHPQEPQEHPCSRRLWQGPCPPWLSGCVAVCGKPSCNGGRSTSRIAPYPSTTSTTSWPCSTTSWPSGNGLQPQHLSEQPLHLQGTTSSPSPLYIPGYPSPPFSLSSSSSVPTLHPNSSCREVPASLRAALDRTQKKACQLLLEELLLDLQVRLPRP